MISTFNSLKPFYYPFAGAWGSLVLSHAPVFFGAGAWGLLRYSASAKWGFCPTNCGNPTNLVRLPQLGTGDKMVLPSTGGIGQGKRIKIGH